VAHISIAISIFSSEIIKISQLDVLANPEIFAYIPS
jgi:hypothetical protein